MKLKNLNYPTLGFLTLGLIPILPPSIMGFPIVIFTIFCIFYFLKYSNKKLNYGKFFTLILPYLVFCFSIFFSEDYNKAIKVILETRLSLFLVPFNFFLLNNSARKQIKRNILGFYKLFCGSTLVICILYILYLPLAPISQNPNFRFPSGFFFKSSLSNLPIWKPEPVYLSFIIIIAFILLVKLRNDAKIKVLYFSLISVVFISVLLVLVSKLAIIFLGIFLFWILNNTIRSVKVRICCITLLVISLYPISKIPAVHYEVQEVMFYFKGEKKAKDDPNDKRSKIFATSVEMASDVNLIFGCGTGDIQKLLNKKYAERGYEELLVKKYDTHNQFMSMYLSTGLIGILALLYLFIYVFQKCKQLNNKFLFAIISFIFLQMLTENLLERQLSVFVFSIFNSIIIFIEHEEIY